MLMTTADPLTIDIVSWSFVLFFFFQAEDGIRDLTVTGVQTCALPIYVRGVPRASLRTAAAPQAHGDRGPPRTEDGPRLLRLHGLEESEGAVEAPSETPQDSIAAAKPPLELRYSDAPVRRAGRARERGRPRRPRGATGR